jgi:pimeloyl-[acyl-carrier protein] methyl ester esterase
MPFFEFKGYKLFYTDSDPSSSLPVLTFIPGWTASHKIYTSQIEYFTPHYRVLTLDLLGHGQSSKPTPSQVGDLYNHSGFQDSVLAFLQHLKIQKTSLVGWSLGSEIAMEVARRNPQLVSNLVLAGASPMFVLPDDTDPFPALPQAVMKGLLTALETQWEEMYVGLVCSFFAEYTSGEEIPGYIKSAIDDAGRMGGEIARGIQVLVGPRDFRPTIGEIKTRTLIIGGRKDHLTPVEAGKWMASHLGGETEMIVYEEAGHNTFAGPFAKRFNEDVAEFLRKST